MRDIIDWEMYPHYYTPFGKEVVEAFKLLTDYGMASNKGVPQEIIDFHIRYYNWQTENKIDTTNTWNDLFKTYMNNKDVADFTMFADLELFKQRDDQIVEQLKQRDAAKHFRDVEREYKELLKEREQ